MNDRRRRLVAELVGTALLIFIGAGSATLGGTLLAVAFAHGLTVMLVAVTFGRVSGAHLNPTVSIVLAATGRMDRSDVPGYVAAQLAGGLLGAALLLAMVGTDVAAGGLGATVLAPGVSQLQGFLAEVFGTFILLTVIHGAAIDRRANGDLAPLTIGLGLVAAILATGPVSGAALNLARTIGPFAMGVFTDFDVPWAQLPFVYVVGPLVGGLAAAATWAAVVGPDDEQVPHPPGRVPEQPRG